MKKLGKKNLPLPQRVWWPWDQPSTSVGFQTIFNIKQPTKGTLYLSYSGSAEVWLDRKSLNIPESHLPSWRSMRSLPVSLPAGEHTLTILAERGETNQPFLLACLDWMEGGELHRVASGADWKMTVDPPKDLVKSFKQLKTRKAWAFDGVWAEPWGMPCNVPEDFCRLTHGMNRLEKNLLTRVENVYQGLTPAGACTRVLKGSGIEFTPVRPFPPGPPRIPNQLPHVMWHLVREIHSKNNNEWLDLFEARAPHVVLDAEEEVFARVRVTVKNGGPAILALTTGESVQECHRYNRRITDIFQLNDGESFVTSPIGFRYVKIMALSSSGSTVEVEPLELQTVYYPGEIMGDFASSDPLLDEIWELSARTLHLCMQNEIWDGAKRDVLPWMGDLYTEALASYHLFQDASLARRSLNVLAELSPAAVSPVESQRYPGLVSIWKIPNGDINGIPSYTMWWFVGLWDYYLYTGDLSLIKENINQISSTLEHIAGWIDSEGHWRLNQGFNFIDWSPVPEKERETFSHLLAYQVFGLGFQMLEKLGIDPQKYCQIQRKMEICTRKKYGKAKRFEFGNTHHVNAMAIRSGILNAKECVEVFSRKLAQDPCTNMTYWHRYADLEAAALADQIEWGLDYIRKHWGMAVQTGMTSLWETFDADWIGEDPHAVSMIADENAGYGGYRTSQCHGWSAGPLVWLHTAILGIKPITPGFEKVSFNPNLGDLEWAEGSIPTPYGAIDVLLNRNDSGHLIAEIIHPKQIQLLPAVGVSKKWKLQITQCED